MALSIVNLAVGMALRLVPANAFKQHLCRDATTTSEGVCAFLSLLHLF